MVAAKPVSSPMSTTTSLSAFDGTTFDDPTLYRSTIGALQYLCITRPDISYTVNKLSQFMQKPSVIYNELSCFWIVFGFECKNCNEKI
jgi:hypothetical protein